MSMYLVSWQAKYWEIRVCGEDACQYAGAVPEKN